MSKRKIADCVNIRIKVGDFQHIEIVKYAEEEIEYTSNEDRISKEDALTESLVDSVMRSLKAIPERIGKGRAAAIEVEQSISKAIPAWLANDPVPNIANNAKKTASTEIDKQMADKEKALALEKKVLGDEDIKPVVKSKPITLVVAPVAPVVEQKKTVAISDEDLFADDAVSTPVTVTANAEPKKSAKEDDGFDLFSDQEDLFGDK